MKTLLTVQITQEEYESLPLELRVKISKRWKKRATERAKADAFMDALDYEEDP